jgi:thiol-disulfide isomerase/thioredoxin
MRLLSPQFLLALAILLAASACHQRPDWQLDILDPVTQITSSLSANDIPGKRIFINYWAEWCKPCITEIPELNHFALQHKEKVMVLGFDFDRKQGAELLAAMQKIGMAFPATLIDPATVFAIPEISGLPTTLVLDEQGRLITALMGPQTMATLEQALLMP